MKKFNNYLPRLGLVCVILAAALQGCFSEGSDVQMIRPGAGDETPVFKFTLTDGSEWNMERHAGKAVVITFMASWCPCSKESIPIVKEAYSLYNSKGVDFLMVGIHDGSSKFKGFVEEKGVPFPAGFDGGHVIAKAYGVRDPPTTVFIDKAGKVKKIHYGNIKEVGKETFFTWFKEVL